MGLFDGLFDFNGNGKTDPFEQAMGCELLLSNEEENSLLESDGLLESGGAEDCLDALRDKLSELEDQRFNLELQEPDDIILARYERWEARKEKLEEQISKLEDEVFDLKLEFGLQQFWEKMVS